MNLRKSQRVFKSTLKDRCDVYSKERVRVGMEWKELYIRVEKDVPCRVSTLQRQDTEGLPNNRQEFITPYVLYTLPIKIKQDDRVHFKNNWYEVTTKVRNPSFLDHHYESPIDTTDEKYKVVEMKGGAYLEQI